MLWPERSSVQLALSLVSPGTSPSAAAQRHDVCQRMRQTLALLGSHDQEILWMRHYDDLTFKEAAALLSARTSKRCSSISAVEQSGVGYSTSSYCSINVESNSTISLSGRESTGLLMSRST